MNIDWSKAPEGATHKDPDTDCFYKLVKDVWHLIFGDGESVVSASIYNGETKPSDLIERPKKQEAWDGEGLPPEKCDCEVLWSSDTGEYVTATVLAHDQGGAIVRYTSGKNKGCISEQIVGCFNFKGCQIPNFRPIKTAEQLAEEEREKAIADMMEVTSDGISCIGQDDALALYKAGYRKQ